MTESAILTASIENLSIKGPLPVGEVGKALTEISGMSQLSLHLKEKFGGLKKFLEKFPEIFVFSNDHPFNPHVLLRSELSPEHQKIIYRGVIPMQIMTTYKKVNKIYKHSITTTYDKENYSHTDNVNRARKRRKVNYPPLVRLR